MVSTVGHPFPVENNVAQDPGGGISEEKAGQNCSISCVCYRARNSFSLFQAKCMCWGGFEGSPRKFDVSPVVCRSQKNWDLMYGLKKYLNSGGSDNWLEKQAKDGLVLGASYMWHP